MNAQKIICVVGPTAVGKSDLAVELARRFGGEVISADSRQVYKGLDIGSGKITDDEMKGVPHYLLDVVSPKKTFTADHFKAKGREALEEIAKRGKLPIICGGTGFYIDILLGNSSTAPVPPDPELRRRLSRLSAEALYKKLAKADPRRAKEMDPNNKVRLIRALEIVKALGKVPAVEARSSEDTLWIGLDIPREELRQKIAIRLEKRLKAGMIDEVKKLRRQGVSWKRLYDLGLEYRYVSLYLRKELSLEEMKEKLLIEIGKYAKRQMTWFKRNKEIRWFRPEDAKAIQRAALSFLESKKPSRK